MTFQDELLPKNPFFNCDPAGFSVIDADQMKFGLRSGQVAPVLILRVGKGNIFEERPKRVVSRQQTLVTVECDAGVTVYLDFEAEAARKRTSDGEFVYLGGLDDGNEGKGYMRAS